MDMNDLTLNPEMAQKAQTEYCEKNDLPCFIPPLNLCGFCGKNIFQDHYDVTNKKCTNGITVAKASLTLITSCPHCCKSFCD